MQEAKQNTKLKTVKFLVNVIACLLAYGLTWSSVYSLLWFMDETGLDSLSPPFDFGNLLLTFVWNFLCPDWPILATGGLLAVLTCFLLPRIKEGVRSSLACGLVPAGVVLFFFGFTGSGVLPALLVLVASWIVGSLIARTWQRKLFGLPHSGRSLVHRGG